MPVVAFVNLRSAEASVRLANAFRKGLDEAGYVEGQNVTVEYNWLEGRFDRLSSLMADLAHRRVAVIATPGTILAAQAAKAATTVRFAMLVNPENVPIAARAPAASGTSRNVASVENL